MYSAEDFGSPEDFESEEIGATVKTFVFIVYFFFFLSHRKHRTIKGGRGNTKETDFQVTLYTSPMYL